jgi:hypothetical protein
LRAQSTAGRAPTEADGRRLELACAQAVAPARAASDGSIEASAVADTFWKLRKERKTLITRIG